MKSLACCRLLHVSFSLLTILALPLNLTLPVLPFLGAAVANASTESSDSSKNVEFDSSHLMLPNSPTGQSDTPLNAPPSITPTRVISNSKSVQPAPQTVPPVPTLRSPKSVTPTLRAPGTKITPPTSRTQPSALVALPQTKDPQKFSLGMHKLTGRIKGVTTDLLQVTLSDQDIQVRITKNTTVVTRSRRVSIDQLKIGDYINATVYVDAKGQFNGLNIQTFQPASQALMPPVRRAPSTSNFNLANLDWYTTRLSVEDGSLPTLAVGR